MLVFGRFTPPFNFGCLQKSRYQGKLGVPLPLPAVVVPGEASREVRGGRTGSEAGGSGYKDQSRDVNAATNLRILYQA